MRPKLTDSHNVLLKMRTMKHGHATRIRDAVYTSPQTHRSVYAPVRHVPKPTTTIIWWILWTTVQKTLYICRYRTGWFAVYCSRRLSEQCCILCHTRCSVLYNVCMYVCIGVCENNMLSFPPETLPTSRWLKMHLAFAVRKAPLNFRAYFASQLSELASLLL